MIKRPISSVFIFSMVLSFPKPATADLKDALIGGAIGAVINQSIKNSKPKQNSTKNAAAPSLNSQYTRDERRQIQTALNGLGMNVGTVDGVLGKKSRAAISQFQASRGEQQTGQLTRPQFVALTGAGFGVTAAVVDRPLNPNEVVMLQQSLGATGFFTAPVDGLNGQTTENARLGFLMSSGQNPAQVTQVQSLVLAASAAGYQPPAYLVQEAQSQYAAAQSANPFGAPQPQQGIAATQLPQQTLFGAQPAQPAANAGFGQPPMQAQPQQNNLFGQPPQQTTGFGQPAPQGATGFGTTQQPVQTFGAPAPQTNGGFATPTAPATAQPTPLFGTQPAPVPQQPATQQNQGIFATTTPQQAQQPLASPTPQQPQSSLDVFTLQTAAPGAETGATPPQQNASNGDNSTTQLLFMQPATTQAIATGN